MKRFIYFWTVIMSICFAGTVDMCHANGTGTTIEITTPSDFQSWKPEGGTPQNPNRTNSVAFTVKVKGIPVNHYCKIDVKLEDVTNWKGICANYPKENAYKDRDLKFLKGDNIDWHFESDKHLSYKTNTHRAEPTVTKTVTVRSYDYGAYGKLVVRVNKRRYGFYTVLLAETDPDDNDPKNDPVTIPIDKNGNKIADGWEDDAKRGWSAAADDENVPAGNFSPGDGLVCLR